METITLRVSGMSCMGCVNSVKNLLGAVGGVGKVDVDLAGGRVDVEYDPAQAHPDALKAAIQDGGYRVVD